MILFGNLVYNVLKVVVKVFIEVFVYELCNIEECVIIVYLLVFGFVYIGMIGLD